jgi:O-antigen/teichoic acid export membrane protein
MSNSSSGFSWLLAEKAVRVASGLLVTAAVARHLGPEGYGHLSVALGLMWVVNSAATMGADHVNVSELSRRDGRDAWTYLGSAILVRVLWSFISLALLWVVLFFYRTGVEDLLLILSFGIPISVLGIFGDKVIASGRFKAFAVAAIVAVVVGGSIRLYGVVADKTIPFFALAGVLESAVLATALAVAAVRLPGFTLGMLMPSMKLVMQYWRMCLPIAFSAALVTVAQRIELFAIDAMLGKDAAGEWAVVQMFILPWAMVAVSVASVANQRMARLEAGGVDYGVRFVSLIRRMVGVSLLAAAINAAAARVLIPLLLGPAYEVAIDLVMVASAALIPLFLGAAQEIWLANTRNTGVVLRKVLLSLPLAVILLLVLLPRFGLLGAAISMVCATFISVTVFNVLFDRSYVKLMLRACGLRVA